MKTMNLLIIIMAIIVLMLLNGCVTRSAKLTGFAAKSYQTGSATKIGCLPEEITITDQEGGFVNRARSWYATCKGKTYFCTGVNEHGGLTDVSCMKNSPKSKNK